METPNPQPPVDRQAGFKSWFTTILGCLIMTSQVFEYGWEMYYKGVLWEAQDYVQASLVMGGGFALLFMKEKIGEWIAERFKK